MASAGPLTGGLHTLRRLEKLGGAAAVLLVGADVCMVTFTLIRQGVEYLAEMLGQIQNWLDVNGYESIEQLKGSVGYGNSPDSGNFERANYMKAIVSYTAAR